VYHIACWNTKGICFGTGLSFVSGTKLWDYHESMNGEHFERWMLTQLPRNLEEPSVIIGNDPHHSVLAGKSRTQLEKTAWLQENERPFAKKAFKAG
jgi:hypothetical protein